MWEASSDKEFTMHAQKQTTIPRDKLATIILWRQTTMYRRSTIASTKKFLLPRLRDQVMSESVLKQELMDAESWLATLSEEERTRRMREYEGHLTLVR